MKHIRVAIIGAGAAGLAALRNLSKNSIFQPVAYEAEEEVGGTWIYDKLPFEFDPTSVNLFGQSSNDKRYQCHSSMYNELVTNIPKEIMAYPDFPFPQHLPSYVSRQDVLAYLQKYAEFYRLLPYIKFRTKVEKVSHRNVQNKSLWEVVYVELPTARTHVVEFDAVIVCNGHYSKTYYPDISGADQFPGALTHSHYYRESSIYKDKIVVLMGAGPSGTDIATELVTSAKKVYLATHIGRKNNLPDEIIQKNSIARFHSNGYVEFDDDSEMVKADCVIICTGYSYDFPFLSQDCGIQLDNSNRRICPLYKHVFHINHPTLSFIGIPSKITPFPQFFLQAQVISAVLQDRNVLPSVEEMIADQEKDYQNRLINGLKPRHAHFMGHRQWTYHDELAALIHIKNPIPKASEKLYKYAMGWRDENITKYRRQNYRIVDEDTFEHIGEETSRK